MNKQKQGMSLIELTIAMTLMIILSVIIGSLYLSGFTSYRRELAQTSIQSNAQTILDNIMNDTKNAQSVEETYRGYESGNHTIILRVPALDTNKNILYSHDSMLFDRIIYYYDNNKIHKVTYAQTNSIRYKENNLNKTIDESTLQLHFSYEPDDVDHHEFPDGHDEDHDDHDEPDDPDDHDNNDENSATLVTLVTINVSSYQQFGKINPNVSLIGKARLRNHL